MKPAQDLTESELRNRLRQLQALLEKKFETMERRSLTEKEFSYFELLELREAATLRELRSRGVWERNHGKKEKKR